MSKEELIPLDKNMFSRRNYLTGLTLVEVLVAAVILALVVTGLAYVFIAGQRQTAHIRALNQATELSGFFLAPLQLEEVRGDLWSTNCLGNGTGCLSSPANDTTIEGTTFQPNVTVSRGYAGTDLVKVKLRISWNETTP